MSHVTGRPAFESDLLAWGRVIALETRGRRSGQPRRVNVGFVEGSDGSFLVAASSGSANWALNLQAHPICHTERSGLRETRRAVPLLGAERDHVIQSLILKYGTPSEALGAGPAFRLEPVDSLV
jgi:deazaflavin-dependent oxidoreductase (nitroreductase family)